MNDPLDTMVLPPTSDWPDPLLTAAGQRIFTPDHWPARRQEIIELMLPLAYGRLAPTPQAIALVRLHSAVLRRFAGTRLLTCRLEPDAMPAFTLRLFVPPGAGPFPAIVSGDGCWRYADDAALAAIVGRGYVLAEFSRVEVAPDPGGPADGLAMAQGKPRTGTLAAWAWAYHRVVDALEGLDWIDPHSIAVVGHSRGGKAALLAGATDERIALTSANNSGAGGAGCFRHQGPGSENLADLLGTFGYWFDPQLGSYVGREQELPFDQHFLKALVAPRVLLTTEALGDHWANPQGSWQTHRAARCVFDLLGVPDNNMIAFREGGHDHTLADWNRLLEIADQVLLGKAALGRDDADPFPDLPLPARWMVAHCG